MFSFLTAFSVGYMQQSKAATRSILTVALVAVGFMVVFVLTMGWKHQDSKFWRWMGLKSDNDGKFDEMC